MCREYQDNFDDGGCIIKVATKEKVGDTHFLQITHQTLYLTLQQCLIYYCISKQIEYI